MPSDRIVEPLDVVEHIGAGRVRRRVVLSVHALVLSVEKKTIHGPVVPHFAGAAHAAGDAQRSQLPPEVLTAILGGFSRSSHHLLCEVEDDEEREGTVGPLHAAPLRSPGRPPVLHRAGVSLPVFRTVRCAGLRSDQASAGRHVQRAKTLESHCVSCHRSPGAGGAQDSSTSTVSFGGWVTYT